MAGKRASSAERKEQIAALAERRFAELGYYGVSMEGLAKEIGLSKAMVYNYVGPKQELYVTCLRRARRSLHAALAAAAAQSADPAEQVFHGALEFFTFAAERPDAWTILNEHTSARRGPFADEVAASRAALSRLVGGPLAAARGGAGDSANAPATQIAAFTTVGAADGMVRWWLEHPNVPKEHVVARFMDVVWMGLENLRNDRLWEHSLRPEPFAAEPPGVPDSPAQRGEAPRSAGATASSHEPPAGAIGSGPFVAAGGPMSTASRRAARAAREEQILVVAERRFTESGYRAVSMDEIAKEVGLSKAMVYNYVGDKESLYLACFRRARQRLEGTIDAGAIEGDSWEERFRYGMLGVLAFVEANREPWLMVHEHVLDRKGPFAAEMQDMRAHMSRLITQHFAEARRDAGLALSGRGVELSAHAVLGAIEQVASWWLEECPEIPRSEIADGMVGVLYDGLGAAARPDGAPTARAR